MPPDLLENVAWMRTQTELPICIGFGISSPDQVKLLAPAADGIIVGSAIVRKMEAAAKNPCDVAVRDQTVKDVGAFAAELAAALG